MRRMMPLAVVAGFITPFAAAAQPAPSAQIAPSAMPDMPAFATAAEVQGLIDKAKASIKPGQTLLSQPLVRMAPYAATLEYRPVPAPPSVHATNAEFIYIVRGTGTITLGGTMTDPKAGAGGNSTGSGIVGGTPRPVGPGDMLIVPEGTPHQFSAIGETLIGLTIKLPRPIPAAAK